MTPGRPPRGRPVRAPAPDLPPQSFGRNGTWQLWAVFCGFIVGFVELLMVLRWIFVLHGRFELADFLFPLVVYGLVAALAWIRPDTWVAGGDGWLMQLRGRRPGTWVRTSRLVSVGLESKYEGDGAYAMHLTLRDDEGRELATWLRKLPPEAAASLLAGISRSSETGLADLSSPAAQLAVTALGQRARPASAAEVADSPA